MRSRKDQLKEKDTKEDSRSDDSLTYYFKDLFIESPYESEPDIKGIDQKLKQMQVYEQAPIIGKSQFVIVKPTNNYIHFSHPAIINYQVVSPGLTSSQYKSPYYYLGNNNSNLYIPQEKTLLYLVEAFKSGQLINELCIKDFSRNFKDLNQTDSNHIMNLILMSNGIISLITHRNSSFLIRLLLKQCTSDIRLKTIESISYHIEYLCKDINGAQVFKLLSHLAATNTEQHLLQTIAAGNLLSIVSSQISFDFIIILIKKITEELRKHLNRAIILHFKNIVLHPLGLHIVSS